MVKVWRGSTMELLYFAKSYRSFLSQRGFEEDNAAANV